MECLAEIYQDELYPRPVFNNQIAEHKPPSKSMNKTNIEYILISVKDIKKNPNNPRIIKDVNFRKLVKSIKEFPDMLHVRTIVIDENNMILGGNQRFEAVKEAKIPEITVTRVSGWSEEKKREFILKDNSHFGEWDMDMLANEWDLGLLESANIFIPEIAEEKGELADSEGFNNLSIYPLAITLNTTTYKEWKNYKKQNNFASDTDAFLNIFKNLHDN